MNKFTSQPTIKINPLKQGDQKFRRHRHDHSKNGPTRATEFVLINCRFAQDVPKAGWQQPKREPDVDPKTK
jgi:hypothetical protein